MSANADNGEKLMGVWSDSSIEWEAATYLIAEIKKAVENSPPNVQTMVRDIAAQIMRDLDTLAATAREHD